MHSLEVKMNPKLTFKGVPYSGGVVLVCDGYRNLRDIYEIDEEATELRGSTAYSLKNDMDSISVLVSRGKILTVN